MPPPPQKKKIFSFTHSSLAPPTRKLAARSLNVYEQLSDPLLLLIFKFQFLFRERTQISLIFNEISNEVFYLIARQV